MAALKLFSLRNVLRSTVAPQSHPLIRMNLLRRLSTESVTAQDASDDPFLRTPEKGEFGHLVSAFSLWMLVDPCLRGLNYTGVFVPLAVVILHFCLYLSGEP